MGIEYSFQNNINNSISGTESLRGFVEGLIYRGVIETTKSISEKIATDYTDNVKRAYDGFSKLNEDYNKAFHDQEKQVTQFYKDINDKFNNIQTNSDNFFTQQKKRIEDLENLYADKLRLEKPAEYWQKMYQVYQKKGNIWMWTSSVIAIILVISLALFVAFMPNFINENSYWFDIIKNSAVLSIIAGIGLYVLRMCFKMAMSSYHLSRDAKEREQLSYFYLALVHEKAITDKERALIVNSLFSRSDTGLLKGESTPTMSANITDLTEKIT